MGIAALDFEVGYIFTVGVRKLAVLGTVLLNLSLPNSWTNDRMEKMVSKGTEAGSTKHQSKPKY